MKNLFVIGILAVVCMGCIIGCDQPIDVIKAKTNWII